jgi:undecaprenyl-diphosphatase
VSARLLLVLALGASAMPLQPFDDAVRADVQSTRSRWLEAPMRAASDDARPVLVAGLVVAAVSGAAGRAFALEAGAALLPVNALVEAIKYATDRARPGGVHHRSNAAFPSSHAANAFAIAVVLARRWKRAVLPALAAAAVVAYSRLYLDRHWCTDVLAGAVLGAGMAWWAVGAWRRWRSARQRGAAPAGAPPA